MSENKFLPNSVGEFFVENGIDGYPDPCLPINEISIFRVSISELHKDYKDFCSLYGHMSLSKKGLRKALINSGFLYHKNMICGDFFCAGFQLFKYSKIE